MIDSFSKKKERLQQEITPNLCCNRFYVMNKNTNKTAGDETDAQTFPPLGSNLLDKILVVKYFCFWCPGRFKKLGE